MIAMTGSITLGRTSTTLAVDEVDGIKREIVKQKIVKQKIEDRVIFFFSYNLLTVCVVS